MASGEALAAHSRGGGRGHRAPGWVARLPRSRVRPPVCDGAGATVPLTRGRAMRPGQGRRRRGRARSRLARAPRAGRAGFEPDPRGRPRLRRDPPSPRARPPRARASASEPARHGLVHHPFADHQGAVAGDDCMGRARGDGGEEGEGEADGPSGRRRAAPGDRRRARDHGGRKRGLPGAGEPARAAGTWTGRALQASASRAVAARRSAQARHRSATVRSMSSAFASCRPAGLTKGSSATRPP